MRPLPRRLGSWFLPLMALVLVCEPAHVLSAATGDPGIDAFAPPDTPAQYAPDRILDLAHADIAVFPDLVDQRITGVVRYRAELLDPEAREITLDAVGLDIRQASIDGAPVSVRREDDAIHLALPPAPASPAPASPGPDPVARTVEIEIAWESAPDLGLYFFGPDQPKSRTTALHEGDEAPPTRGLPERRHALQAWTQGEMHETRHWLPTWDYPNDRFSTSWHIVAPAGFSVVANGEAQTPDKLGAATLAPSLSAALEAARAAGTLDDASVWHFEQAGDHVSYLLSFVVGRFDVVREDWRGRPVEYWVPQGRADEARATFTLTPQMLDFFSDWIGVEFPWAKYAQTTVQEFTFGGMENVSATTMTDRMLHPARLDPIMDRQGLVAHELAHQWWGDLLTCRDWGHVWLNEGFATYFTALWFEHHGGEDEFALSRRGMASSYFAEARRYRRPIVTRAYRRASMMFDRHTYPKGGWVLHMLRRELGDADFRRSLARYAAQNTHALVETADLQRAIREATGRNLDRFFAQWVYGAGHPELRSSWRHDPKTKTVILSVEQDQDAVFEFPLELEFVHGDQVVAQRVWVDRRSAQIVVPSEAAPDFVLVDAGMHLLAELDQVQTADQWRAQLATAARGIDRLRAAQALAAFDRPEVVASLAAALASDPFHAVRSSAAASLGTLGGVDATAALVDQLITERDHPAGSTPGSTSDPRVRRATLSALAQTHGPLAKAELGLIVDHLEDDPDDFVRAAAATALIRFGGPTGPEQDKRARKLEAKLHAKAQKALRAALEQRSFNEEVEQAAVRALGAIGEADRLDVLLACLEPVRPTYLRIAAVDALLVMRQRPGVLDPKQRVRAALAVAALADDPNMRIRRAVVDDLGDLDLPDASTRLRKVINREDRDSQVRSLAEDELRGLQ